MLRKSTEKEAYRDRRHQNLNSFLSRHCHRKSDISQFRFRQVHLLRHQRPAPLECQSRCYQHSSCAHLLQLVMFKRNTTLHTLSQPARFPKRCLKRNENSSIHMFTHKDGQMESHFEKVCKRPTEVQDARETERHV